MPVCLQTLSNIGDLELSGQSDTYLYKFTITFGQARYVFLLWYTFSYINEILIT